MLTQEHVRDAVVAGYYNEGQAPTTTTIRAILDEDGGRGGLPRLHLVKHRPGDDLGIGLSRPFVGQVWRLVKAQAGMECHRCGRALLPEALGDYAWIRPGGCICTLCSDVDYHWH